MADRLIRCLQENKIATQFVTPAHIKRKMERERLESKKISKTNAVTSQLDYEIEPENIYVGPSDYVPWLADRKFCYVKIKISLKV
jgi:myo-inositol-1-phosphate synthase